MKLELRQVTADEKPILANLMEKYLYEFSTWEKTDVSALGLYGYDWLDCYWTEKGRWAFFILADGKLAGFVMVNDYQETPGIETDYAMSEFFIMNKYKRMGVGSYAARTAFEMFKGKWQLKYLPSNVPSQLFWDRIVPQCAPKTAELHIGLGTPYENGERGNVWTFDTSKG